MSPHRWRNAMPRRMMYTALVALLVIGTALILTFTFGG